MLVFTKAMKLGKAYTAEDAWKNFYVAYDEGKPWKKIAELFAEVTGTEAKRVEWGGAGIVQQSVSGQDVLVDASELIVDRYVGANMIVKSDNARSLGWEPKAPKIDQVLKQMTKSNAPEDLPNGHAV